MGFTITVSAQTSSIVRQLSGYRRGVKKVAAPTKTLYYFIKIFNKRLLDFICGIY